MIHFEIPKNQSSIIKVIGVGGGGGNAINYMYNLGIDGVDFVICNTDSQALSLSPVPNKIQLGPHLTQGLGAGANPEIGKQASEESNEDISKILKVNTRMAFITAGMGGGTGTGGAPVVSKICRDLGILTVGIVTMPFTYEGRKRMKQAQEGIDRMREHVDTILIVSNDKLRQQFGNLPFTQAFAKADDILATATKCITDVINTTGQINVDFADVCTVMRNGGVAILGNSTVAGENRASHAVEQALNSPLLNDSDIRGAKWILLNINSAAGEFEHTMDEAEAIQAYVQQQAGDNCDVILGMGHDPNLGDRISVTIIATGFNQKEFTPEPMKSNEPEKIMVTLGSVDTQTNSVMNAETPHSATPASFNAVAPVTEVTSMSPTLVEAPVTPSGSFDPKPAFPVSGTPATPEVKETFVLKMDTEATTTSEVAPVFQAPVVPATPVAPVAQVQPEIDEDHIEVAPMEMIIKEEPINMPAKIGSHVLTENELEEKRRFEEQKRALEDRAERLRRMSFNVKGAESTDDLENVPAYMRQNIKIDDNNASSTNFYSNYSVGKNNDQQQVQASIQTINTFLDGKKPD